MPLPAGRHWIRGPAATTTAALMAVLGTVPADAAPSGGSLVVGPTVTAVAALRAKLTGPKSARPARVTLVTGDTVTYVRDGSGHESVTVDPGPDRADVTFHATASPDGYYVIPSDAEKLVGSGLLDKRLFDVKYLVDNGYADTTARQVPVIVQYAQRMAATTVHQKADALPASTSRLTLGSINGAAVRVDKKDAGSFWATVRGSAGKGAAPGPGAAASTRPQLGGGLAHVWLDAKARALDDVSNPQIGAPTAWAAGYDGTGVTVGVIDTGIDATHPDFEGKIVAAQNFVPAGEPGGGDPSDVTDRFGHGTHVASIIAGTGAASDGRYQGVVPNAGLTIAKALSDAGSGSDSTIIAAMEWQAATAHARIVNMSLGAGPTDGTDPLSQAVNDLTARYGTLFVVAAGNSGPEAKTVGTPGAATSALTVAAVDSTDAMAYFSSRGPRLGDGAIKPEIAAPGWNIAAARAKGTSLGAGSSVPGGGPIDDYYTRASGTSMATPHVAGAAAAVLQQHPDWTGEQIKTALVGTAKDVGAGVYEQGAGRVDVGRVVTQHVFDDTTSVAAEFDHPHTGGPLTRTVTYRNTGDADVTLDLAAGLTRNGAPVGGVASVAPATLTVPAGGTASAVLSLDPTGAPKGLYSGALTATDAVGDHLTVPLAVRIRPPMHTLRVRVDATSVPIHLATPTNFDLGYLSASRVNDDNPDLADEPLTVSDPLPSWTLVDERGVFEATLEMPEGGIYDVLTQASFRDNNDGRQRYWYLMRNEVGLDSDTIVTFDLAATTRVDVRTERPSVLSTANVGYQRTTASGLGLSGYFLHFTGENDEIFLSPTQSPAIGTFAAWVNETRPAAQATLALSGGRKVDLGVANYASEYNWVPKFDSDQHLTLIGEAELRAGKDPHGSLVVADPAAYNGVDDSALDHLLSTMDLAAQRGAAGVLTDSIYIWSLWDPYYRSHTRIPTLWIDRDRMAVVRAALADTQRPSVDVHADSGTPYEYHVTHYVYDRTPETLRFTERTRDMVALDTTYHAQYETRYDWGPLYNAYTADATYTGSKVLDIVPAHHFVNGTRQTVYYNATAPEVMWDRLYQFDDAVHHDDPASLRAPIGERYFLRPGSGREDWNEPILPTQITPGPGALDSPRLPVSAFYPCDGCRQGDRVRLRALATFGAGLYTDAGDSSHTYIGEPGTEEFHLYRADGDAEVPVQADDLGLPYFGLPEGDGTYRLTDTYTDGFTGVHTGTRVDTTWTFHSARPSSDDVDLPYLCIDSVLYGDDNACAFLPLIYLKYHFGLTPQDTAPAGRPYTFTVTTQDVPGTPKPAGVKVWISPDGGKTWTRAVTTPGPDGTYQVFVTNPPRSASPTGTVTVRTQAWDADGNAVEQTIKDAYVLK